jgi:hypothetical protein
MLDIIHGNPLNDDFSHPKLFWDLTQQAQAAETAFDERLMLEPWPYHISQVTTFHTRVKCHN